MKTKRLQICTLITILLLSPSVGVLYVSSSIPPNSTVNYAVIITGAHRDLTPGCYRTTYFVEWVLRNPLIFNMPRENMKILVDTNDSQLLPSYVDYDDIATAANVAYYIGTWLASKSGNLLIYVNSHGGGANSTGGDEGGRWEKNGDEGNEYWINETWWGVDENIWLEAENSTVPPPPSQFFWDDDFRGNISSIQSADSLTIILQGCKSVNDTSSGLDCFMGGFIEDLSNVSSIYHRTIITNSNETGVGWVDRDEVANFTYWLFSAFANCTIHCDWSSIPPIYLDTNSPTNWNYSSWRGAYDYALRNDGYYLKDPDHQEYPWFDDDGDMLPGWVNNREVVLFPRNEQDMMRWLLHDITGPDDYPDGKVNIRDVSFAAKHFGTLPGGARWNKTADAYQDWKIDIKDVSAVARDFGKDT